MKRVNWNIEEAVALYDLYFRCGFPQTQSCEEIINLSKKLNNRAHQLGIEVDEKFRNPNGLVLQIANIHYVVTNGKEGMSNVSKLFYDTYDLYVKDRAKFDAILDHFNNNY